MSDLHIISAKHPPETLSVIGETITVFGPEDSSKPFEVHIQEGTEGGGPPPHYHPWDEAFYVLEGQLDLTINGETQTLAPGSFAHIPANTIHAYRNATKTTKILAIVSDCKGGQMFAAMDAEIDQMPRDAEKLTKLGKRFGVNFNPYSDLS